MLEIHKSFISLIIEEDPGGGGLSLWKNDFELGVGGDGQDTSRHFEGSPYVQYCPCEASKQKPSQIVRYVLQICFAQHLH